MDSVSYAAFRRDLAHLLDKVNDDHKPSLVTRKNGKAAVVIATEDFSSYEETAYLMASPKNAERLNEAVTEFESGQAQEHHLIDE